MSGIEVVVEHSGHRRETLKTNANGEVVVRHKASESCRLIEVRAPHGTPYQAKEQG